MKIILNNKLSTNKEFSTFLTLVENVCGKSFNITVRTGSVKIKYT